MHGPLAGPLVVRPTRSRYIAVYLLVTHAGALAGCVLSELPHGLRWAGMILIVVAFALAIRRWHDNYGIGNRAAFILGSEGGWELREPGRKPVVLKAISPSFVHPWLIVVRLRAEAAPFSRHDLVLPADSLDRETARRLRVRLRYPC